jgi:hypothetical protein
MRESEIKREIERKEISKGKKVNLRVVMITL